MSKRKNARENEKKSLLQEIETLKEELKHTELINKKISLIKKTKIFLEVMKSIGPYALAAGIIVGELKFMQFGWDETKKTYSQVMKEFDSLGGISYIEQDETFRNADNLLYYYSKWRPIGNGFYQRNIEIYRYGKLSEEELVNIFNMENPSLRDLFGNPIDEQTESRNNLAEEEINHGDYYSAVIYYENKDRVIVHNTTTFDELILLFSYLCIFATGYALVVGTMTIKERYSSFKENIETINEQYKLLDTEILRKKLENKADTYNRINRK